MKDKLDAYLMTFCHEAFCLSFLESEVVCIGVEADADTLDVNFFLLGFGLLFFLGLLVDEFPVVGDLADRRFGQRGYLDEISIAFEGEGDGYIECHNAVIFARLINDDYFGSENLLIDTEGVLWANLRLGSIVPSTSHGMGIKNETVELMGIAPMSSHIPSK